MGLQVPDDGIENGLWTPTFLALSVDGVQVVKATAAAPNTTIPYLPGHVLLINRVSTTQLPRRRARRAQGRFVRAHARGERLSWRMLTYLCSPTLRQPSIYEERPHYH